MNGLIFQRNYTKDLLRDLLGMTRTTFKTWMNTLEPEMIRVDPKYNKQNQIIRPHLFRFILEEYGFDDSDDINERINAYYQIKK